MVEFHIVTYHLDLYFPQKLLQDIQFLLDNATIGGQEIQIPTLLQQTRSAVDTEFGTYLRDVDEAEVALRYEQSEASLLPFPVRDPCLLDPFGASDFEIDQKVGMIYDRLGVGLGVPDLNRDPSHMFARAHGSRIDSSSFEPFRTVCQGVVLQVETE